MRRHPACLQLDVASRSLVHNAPFFRELEGTAIWVSTARDDFAYHPGGRCFSQHLRQASLQDYDALFLRLPRPVEPAFLHFMARRLGALLSPLGIVFFGFDPLEDDNGLRVLSDINTLSVGGLPQIQQLSGRPVLQQAADLLWSNVNDTLYGRSTLAVQ